MGSLKELDDEIKRVGDSYYNYTEPIRVGQVTAVQTDSVGIKLYKEGEELDYPYVPVLQPASFPNISSIITGYTITSSMGDNITFTGSVTSNVTDYSLNIAVNDFVIVAFIQGQLSSPIVIGKVPGDYNG